MTIKTSEFAPALLCFAAFYLSLGISSIIVAKQTSVTTHSSCYNTYDGVSFSFMTWLLWSGVMDLVSFAVFLFSMVLFWKGGPVFTCWGVFAVLIVMFNFAWFIVGAVLLFTEVLHCNHSQLWAFGLAKFCINGSSILFTKCTKKPESY